MNNLVEETNELARKNKVQSIEQLAGELMEQIKVNAAQRKFIPETDVWELDGGYRVFIYLPGIQKEQVNLEVKDGFLIISGEKNISPEFEKEKAKLLESNYGYFQRRIKLNKRINTDGIKAQFESGVLNVYLPKIQDEDFLRAAKVA